MKRTFKTIIWHDKSLIPNFKFSAGIQWQKYACIFKWWNIQRSYHEAGPPIINKRDLGYLKYHWIVIYLNKISNTKALDHIVKMLKELKSKIISDKITPNIFADKISV